MFEVGEEGLVENYRFFAISNATQEEAFMDDAEKAWQRP
jgi:hypothetical protein